MFFKGSIYITDPCYISKDEDWMSENGFDVESYSINCSEFTDYLIDATGVGDGSWTVYEVPEGMNLSLQDIYDIIEDTDNDLSEFKEIGKYCADAGMSCVVYRKEADEYNPEFSKEYGGHCYTLIKDFEGKIVEYYDEDNSLHFVGVGNKTFFTA